MNNPRKPTNPGLSEAETEEGERHDLIVGQNKDNDNCIRYGQYFNKSL